ncbi:MAG: gamma-glutamyltransferase [Leptolyngbyaceae bacterium]|nr:gamma-glutamyltransferase [Leptolyngbyaceae bacterium]
MRDFHLPGRSPLYGTHGIAATSHPMATLTAIEVLKAGGNAVDAAIAASAVLCVVEPQATGIGGDCFCLYAPAGTGEVIALNGSGRAPAAAEVQWFLDQGMTEIDLHSAHSVTIPGAVDAWFRLVEDYGRTPFDTLLQPAIRYAETGYPVYPRVAYDWQRAKAALKTCEASSQVFLPNGQPPRPGDLHTQPDLANTLKVIAQQGRDGFYQGAIADAIVTYLQRLGGLHTLEDFATAEGEYVTPISTSYRGYEVLECPPSGQGITALILLNILSGFDLPALDPLGVERFHLLCEATRLAYLERDRYVADPAFASLPVEALLSEAHGQRLRRSIRGDRAMVDLPAPVFPTHPDTVYLCVVDDEGNAISFINSIFHAFGSALMAPHTGVILQNRGAGFQLDPTHFNCIAPRKRPLHTIIPGMLRNQADPTRVVMPFGVMGGEFQPAGHAHLLTNMIDYGMDVQAALDFPRVFHSLNTCQVENGIPTSVAKGLASLGHKVQPIPAPHGGGQAIWINWESGVLMGGSDPRKDGCALAY